MMNILAKNNALLHRRRSFPQWPSMVAGMTLVCCAALIHGCASPGTRLDPPRISLARIDVQSTTLFETVMIVTLRVFNTNTVPLTVKGADATLEVNGRDFARGVTPIDITLPAYDTALVPMTLYSSVVDMIEGILKMKDRQTLTYRIRGSVRIEGGFLMPSSLPFSTEGELSLEDLQPQG